MMPGKTHLEMLLLLKPPVTHTDSCTLLCLESDDAKSDSQLTTLTHVVRLQQYERMTPAKRRLEMLLLVLRLYMH